MSVRKYLTKHKKEMSLIGSIFSVLNRIENAVVTSVSVALINPNDVNQEKAILLNDIICDEKVFCKFEEKRLMFKKVVNRAAFLIKSRNIGIEFDEKKYLDFCEKIKSVQEMRNDIAHNYLVFSVKGVATYAKRKSDGLLLTELGQKKGSMRYFQLNLKKILEEAIELCDYSESIIMRELTIKLISIFNYEQLATLPDKSDGSNERE